MEENVLSRWRGRSIAAGWSLADDWWTPEVELALKAVRRGCDLSGACWALGAARASAGVGIAEGLDDLAALFEVSAVGETPFAALRSFASGWAEKSFAPIGELQCEDPLTGLATVAYVRTRLAQLYRGSVAGTCLVVAEPPTEALSAGAGAGSAKARPAGTASTETPSTGSPSTGSLSTGSASAGATSAGAGELAERLAAALNLATALRTAFPGDETLALFASARVGAITRQDERLAGRVARLRAADILYGHGPLVRVRPLPRAYGQALALIRTLSLEP
ncbi:hypothetical protein SAMN05444920_104340 [Nonomuraea solani]|uniref:Uncharacterized protein n=1 Tax=Nonomuraea solani TaxID=1144553 RepID=A0A1H6CTH2_9ACTN|nr:hypothetical protein [Nonomuraea solani]SEG75973.1 hypothetical protein SAMN05444920_104340 [Nonomuraea solani]